ncbi:MAG: redoxin domain-containing protein [Verrucomicrobia bacterium]|nr:redoxin domain-containing protein [Verrucomicrobiota bacterium]
MYGHERSLVRKFADKPFVLLGVNSDAKARFASAVAKEQMNFRSFSDGSTSGPISTAWNIKGWPSIFVIDAKGLLRIKYTGDPGDDLDTEIEGLIKEALAKK